MESALEIKNIKAREVLDSRGFPTVEAEIFFEDPSNRRIISSSAIVPSGASTGDAEALELRDGDKKRYLGKGTLKAIQNIHEKISPAMTGRSFARQSLVDDLLRELDGTENKSKLGANSILAVSMAFARAMAKFENKSLYESLANSYGSTGATLPVPLMNIINGGEHADNSLRIQEFMIAPVGFSTFKEALRAGVEIFHHLKLILKSKGLSTGVGDEGGFAPQFESSEPHEEALNAIMKAITDAGYKPGRDVFLALDSASSEFAQAQKGEEDWVYLFEGKQMSSSEMIRLYQQWIETYPILSIEDGLSEHDWKGWAVLTEKLGKKCQLVGDDLFVTNSAILKKGIDSKVANSILIKLNQIGTVTETLETFKLASQAGYSAITSHRSGETEDTFIADLAVATDCGQIKTGSASRTDRLAKYNALCRIEEKLGSSAVFSGKNAFEKFLSS